MISNGWLPWVVGGAGLVLLVLAVVGITWRTKAQREQDREDARRITALLTQEGDAERERAARASSDAVQRAAGVGPYAPRPPRSRPRRPRGARYDDDDARTLPEPAVWPYADDYASPRASDPARHALFDGPSATSSPDPSPSPSYDSGGSGGGYSGGSDSGGSSGGGGGGGE